MIAKVSYNLTKLGKERNLHKYLPHFSVKHAKINTE